MGNAKRRQLNAQVWDIAHSIVEAVGEIGGADHQSQFHDLPLVVEFSQLFERASANPLGAARDALGVQDGGLILLVKQAAALVGLHRLVPRFYPRIGPAAGLSQSRPGSFEAKRAKAAQRSHS